MDDDLRNFCENYCTNCFWFWWRFWGNWSFWDTKNQEKDFIPICEEKKMIVPSEKPVFQLSETLRIGNKENLYPLSFQNTKWNHATMLEGRLICLYLEHLSFLIKRPGQHVAKIYSYYTFEQERFKRDYIIMNQNSKQNAKNWVERDFFKHLNNSNFGYDCRNSLNNCAFEPICDEIDERIYI